MFFQTITKLGLTGKSIKKLTTTYQFTIVFMNNLSSDMGIEQ